MNASVSSARIERSLRQRLLAAYRRELPFPPERILLGFSGGPDSLALAILLAGLQQAVPSQVQLVHVDHRIRPESVADARRCADLAHALALPFMSVRLVDHPTALHPGVGLEEAARRARFQSFSEILGERDVLVLAHHAGDQAETVLLHLMHGSGVGGLAGMRPLSDLRVPWRDDRDEPSTTVHIWRPLLSERRGDLLAVIERSGLTPVTDASNDDLSLKRNAVRRRALPALRAIEPTINDRLGTLARIASDEDALLTEHAQRALRDATLPCGGLDVGTLNRFHIALARRVVRCWLQRNIGVEPAFERVEALLELARAGSQDARVDIGEGLVAGCFGDVLRFGTLRQLRNRAWLDAGLLLPLIGASGRVTCRRDTITVHGAFHEGSGHASRRLDGSGIVSVSPVRSGEATTGDSEWWSDWFRQQRISPWIRSLVQGIAVDGVMWWVPRQGDYDDAGDDRRVCVVWTDQERD